MLPDKYGMPSLRGMQACGYGPASRLQVVQLAVVAVESHQLVVRAPLHDASLVQDTYLVGVLYGGQAVRYSHRGARLHELLEGVLHQTLALSVESRGGFIKYQYGRILENGARYAHSLPLTAGEPSSAVAYIGVVSLLGSHDEVVRVGYPRGAFHIFPCGVFHAESDVVVERVVEEYRLLVDVSDEHPQVVYAQVAHVGAVDEHLSLLRVVVARYEVDKSRLAAAALSHERDGLAFLYLKVDVAQNPLLPVPERHVAELYAVSERRDAHRFRLLLYGVLSLQYLVYSLHGRQTFRYVIACLGELLQRIDDAVEHHEVVDEHRSAERHVVKDERATEPQHDDNEQSAEELAHRVGELLACIDPAYLLPVGAVDRVEAAVHLLFGAESLDYAQSAERFLDETHRVAPHCLCLDGLRLELSADETHEPSHHRNDDKGEQGELPADEKERGEVEDNEYGVLEKHVERRHDGALHLLHVAAHAGYDVALALLGEEAQRQRRYLAVELVAYVAHHTGAYRDDCCGREEVCPGLEKRHESQEQSDDEQRGGRPESVYHLIDIIVHVVCEHFLYVRAAYREEHGMRVRRVDLEQNLEYRHYCEKREDIQYRRKNIENNRQDKIFLIRRNESAQYLEKLFHQRVLRSLLYYYICMNT